MNQVTVAALLAGSFLAFAAPAACAQTVAPDMPATAATARPVPAAAAARARRQQQMSPEDAARDQQLQILEARTGNTSFGMERGGPARQLDKSGGAFTVRKFKAMPGQEQERGVSKRVVMGGRTTGRPLAHKRRFLIF